MQKGGLGGFGFIVYGFEFRCLALFWRGFNWSKSGTCSDAES